MTGRPSDNISIVLVRPFEPGNIGAASRAMKNMGLRRLKLVNARDAKGETARRLAVGAFPLIEEALEFDSVGAACGDEQVVVGTTSFRGRLARTTLTPIREAAPGLLDLARTQKVAFLFGPERSGLTEEELARCQHLVTVPADPDFPTLNLAQAVLIVAYELFVAETGGVGIPLPDPASEEEREAMYSHMESTLVSIGFLSQSNPGHIMRSIRRLYAKAELTRRDIRILRGIMRQIDWYMDEGKGLPPERIVKP